MNGNFSRNRDYQIQGLPYNYAYNNTVCPFKLVSCKTVTIKNLLLYGEVDKMKKQEGVVEGENYGVNIADDEPGDTSSNIVLQNITAHHFAAYKQKVYSKIFLNQANAVRKYAASIVAAVKE